MYYLESVSKKFWNIGISTHFWCIFSCKYNHVEKASQCNSVNTTTNEPKFGGHFTGMVILLEQGHIS